MLIACSLLLHFHLNVYAFLTGRLQLGVRKGHSCPLSHWCPWKAESRPIKHQSWPERLLEEHLWPTPAWNNVPSGELKNQSYSSPFYSTFTTVCTTSNHTRSQSNDCVVGIVGGYSTYYHVCPRAPSRRLVTYFDYSSVLASWSFYPGAQNLSLSAGAPVAHRPLPLSHELQQTDCDARF